LVINTSIFLIGDDKDSTIIDGRYIDNVIGVYAPNTWIEDFTIRCSGDDSHLTSAGIYLVSNNNHILNCVFYDNHWALKVTNFNFLNNCYFHDNTYSVSIYGNGNEIINNRFSMNGFGLAVGGNSNTISNNIISDVDQDEALYPEFRI
jgi:parallel beta-helix repeat protein